MDEEVHGVAVDGFSGEAFAELFGKREHVIGACGHAATVS